MFTWTEQSLAWYARAAERSPFHRDLARACLACTDPQDVKDVAEFGCGPGFLALELARASGIHALFAGTDGTDGPTDAAGGFAFSGHVLDWPALGLNPEQSLADNDSYACLQKAGTLYVSGPTRTNVMDAAFILVYPPR